MAPSRYRLLNDTTQWTYGGNNPTLQGASAGAMNTGRSTRRQEHMNINFFHLLATWTVDRARPAPLDFDEFDLVYRNRSLIFPDNGGKLVSWPKDSSDRPETLTDGWRNGPGRMWRSAENPSGPLDFVYTFENPVTIRTVAAPPELRVAGEEGRARDVDGRPDICPARGTRASGEGKTRRELCLRAQDRPGRPRPLPESHGEVGLSRDALGPG